MFVLLRLCYCAKKNEPTFHSSFSIFFYLVYSKLTTQSHLHSHGYTKLVFINIAYVRSNTTRCEHYLETLKKDQSYEKFVFILHFKWTLYEKCWRKASCFCLKNRIDYETSLLMALASSCWLAPENLATGWVEPLLNAINVGIPLTPCSLVSCGDASQSTFRNHTFEYLFA